MFYRPTVILRSDKQMLVLLRSTQFHGNTLWCKCFHTASEHRGLSNIGHLFHRISIKDGNIPNPEIRQYTIIFLHRDFQSHFVPGYPEFSVFQFREYSGIRDGLPYVYSGVEYFRVSTVRSPYRDLEDSRSCYEGLVFGREKSGSSIKRKLRKRWVNCSTSSRNGNAEFPFPVSAGRKQKRQSAFLPQSRRDSSFRISRALRSGTGGTPSRGVRLPLSRKSRVQEISANSFPTMSAASFFRLY